VARGALAQRYHADVWSVHGVMAAAAGADAGTLPSFTKTPASELLPQLAAWAPRHPALLDLGAPSSVPARLAPGFVSPAFHGVASPTESAPLHECWGWAHADTPLQVDAAALAALRTAAPACAAALATGEDQVYYTIRAAATSESGVTLTLAPASGLGVAVRSLDLAGFSDEISTDAGTDAAPGWWQEHLWVLGSAA
jgi:hypothetical protein